MRYYKQIILSLIILTCAFTTSSAQEELLFRHLTRNDGLLHDNVTCIVQDSLGYMWFGSHRGLNRYDGYSIDSYKYENGIINSVYYNRVYSIQIVGHHRLLKLSDPRSSVPLYLWSDKFHKRASDSVGISAWMELRLQK